MLEIQRVVVGQRQNVGQIAARLHIEKMHCDFIFAAGSYAVGDDRCIVGNAVKDDACRVIGAHRCRIDKNLILSVEPVTTVDDVQILPGSALSLKK